MAASRLDGRIRGGPQGAWRLAGVIGLGVFCGCVSQAGTSREALGTPTSSAATPQASPEESIVERLKVRVHAEHPHDPEAFTQGLVFHDGYLYESTGQYDQSTVRRSDPVSGQVQQRVDLAPDLFGEGLALVGDRLFQLTWRRGLALVYERRSFRRLLTLGYRGEGWGLTYDGAALVMSDGSDTLCFRDPGTFEPFRRVRVTLEGCPVPRLNELEWVEGRVYANVWMEDRIVRIDPADGRVDAVIDASGLLTAAERARTDVLNGIAYDEETGRFLITGKLWPRLFEVDFVPADSRLEAKEKDP